MPNGNNPRSDTSYPEVQEPVPVLPAFERSDERAAQTQAAFLLTVGHLLGVQPAAQALRDKVTRAESSRSALRSESLLPEEDRMALEIPLSIYGLESRSPAPRFLGRTADRLRREDLRTLTDARDRSDDSLTLLGEIAPPLAERACNADPEAAADLVAISLRHPEPLVRVAAASSALTFETSQEERALAATELLEGARHEDSLVRDVARTALARFDPEHPILTPLTRPSESEGGDEPSHTGLLVHGTFARRNTWWQPGGDFHTYLKNDVRPDLYSASDRFEWSGGYSDGARSRAARELRTWVADHDLEGLDLFCHSHGGSVAMEATQAGLDVGKLILLSCPVHPGKYDPNFSTITDCVVSIRTRLDLVVLADRGGQRFLNPRIRENQLPIWFKHSATHEEKVWKRHGVPTMLQC